MALPQDFGLSPVQTLAHVADPTPAAEHQPYWNRWLRALGDHVPTLVERSPGGSGPAEIDPSDDTCTHAFESVGYGDAPRVRIGCRLQLPPEATPIRGAVVSTHGYAASLPIAERDRLFEPLLARGIAVLNIRIRGFPGSRLDTGDLNKPIDDAGGPGLGWLCRGLDDPDEGPDGFLRWVYVQAVSDLCDACRAMRRWLNDHVGREATLSLHGESFGGGLAVAAAAELTGRPEAITRLHRLVLGLPTMGEWDWRHAHPISGGSGAEVAELIKRRPERAELIRKRLRVADSVVLAARVRCPVLCKLAERDEIVPAPTAAAVFNHLGVDPGRKWRFVVPHGHAETGLANARRHAEFERCMIEFLAAGNAIEQTMLAWEPRLQVDAEREPAPAGASGPTASLFGDATALPDQQDVALARAYEQAGRTLDDLPYTPEFEQLWSTVAKQLNTDRRGVFHRLHNLRKAGKLPRLGKSATKPPRIEPEEEQMLASMVVDAVGSLGQRDRLPFTADFDRLVVSFNEQTGHDLDPHAVWRLVAKLAK